MRPLTIDEMKSIELEIALEIDRVCRKAGITYFLGYGSLLGAMRHGGFIPWDDDMDLVMMRDDYERFLAIYDEIASTDRFRLVSYRDRTAPNAFAKLVDVTTKVEERYAEAEFGSGVWVDIFPYDEVDPADDRVFKQASRLAAARYLIVTDPKTGATPAIRMAKRLVCPLLKRLDPMAYARKLDELARSAGQLMSERPLSDDERMVADVVAEGDPARRYPRHLFEPVEAEFEGHRFFVPKGYDDILTIAYGDWRCPPPVDQRETHACRAWRL